MNKGMCVGVAALMVAGISGAQNDMSITGLPPAGSSKTSEPEVTAAASLLSSYAWRGQIYNNDAVFQPELTISHYDFSFNLWGNYNLAGSDCNGVDSDFSEIDLSLAYTFPVGISDMALSVGVIHYTFPNVEKESTTEVFATGTITTFEELIVPIIPSVTLFGDVDEARGTYTKFDVKSPYQIGEYLQVVGGISAGYGNTSYNSFYWRDDANAGWNDYNFYGTASYEIIDDVTISANMTYTMLEGGVIEQAGRARYDSKEKFWGGFGVAYDF